MGLFDGLKMAANLVKSGIAAVKASDRLDELIDQAMVDYVNGNGCVSAGIGNMDGLQIAICEDERSEYEWFKAYPAP